MYESPNRITQTAILDAAFILAMLASCRPKPTASAETTVDASPVPSINNSSPVSGAAESSVGGAGGSTGTAGGNGGATGRPDSAGVARGSAGASGRPDSAGAAGGKSGASGHPGSAGATGGNAGTSGAEANTDTDAACAAGRDDGTPLPRPLQLSGNTFAHDPTIIEVDGTFYRFWTGDYIPSATSRDLRSWSNAPTVFRNRYPNWSREWLAEVPDQTFNFPWAPDVSRFDGELHLYSSFSAKFGANVSCITHLTTSDIASNTWTDHGPIICSERSDRYNAIDADVGFDDKGSPWLAFGSFWDGIMLLPLDETGMRKGNDPPVRIAWAPEIEAPVLFRRCEFFYLFVSLGKCCPSAQRRVSDLTYRVVVGRSDSIRGPYVDREGRALLDEGGTLVVAGDRTTFAAAGHSDILVAGDRIYHTYHAYRLPGGEAELRIAEMRFDKDGWPTQSGP